MIYLDRFEGNFAVIEEEFEYGETVVRSVERHLISEECREGDVLVFNGEKYVADVTATELRRKEIFDLLRELTDN